MDPVVHRARCSDRAHVRIPHPGDEGSVVDRITCAGARVVSGIENGHAWKPGAELLVTVQPFKNNETGEVVLTVHRRALDPEQSYGDGDGDEDLDDGDEDLDDGDEEDGDDEDLDDGDEDLDDGDEDLDADDDEE